MFLGDVSNSFLIAALEESVASVNDMLSGLMRAAQVSPSFCEGGQTISVSLYVKSKAEGLGLTTPVRSCF